MRVLLKYAHFTILHKCCNFTFWMTLVYVMRCMNFAFRRLRFPEYFTIVWKVFRKFPGGSYEFGKESPSPRKSIRQLHYDIQPRRGNNSRRGNVRCAGHAIRQRDNRTSSEYTRSFCKSTGVLNALIVISNACFKRNARALNPFSV